MQCKFAQGNKQKVGTLKQVRVCKNTAQTAEIKLYNNSYSDRKTTIKSKISVRELILKLLLVHA